MRRLLAVSALAAATLLLTAARVSAQSAPAVNACEAVRKELDNSRQQLNAARSELEKQTARAAEAEACSAELERDRKALSELESRVASSEAEQRRLCSAAGRFAQGLSSGRVSADGLDQCIGPDVRHGLVEQLSGWSHASSLLQQFGAYSSGESDSLPRVGALAGTKVEKLIARLLNQRAGSPLVFRRLLVEALKLIAPQTWTTIRSAPAGADRWFTRQEPLEPELVAEARAGLAKPSASGAAAPLSLALQLVTAYQKLAGCSAASPPKDCWRAAELRQLLETSGPLVARRVVQDIWNADCSTLSDGVVLEWVAALPAGDSSSALADAVGAAAHSKLFTCFMRDSTAGWSLPAWLGTKLPSPRKLTARALPMLRELESWQPGSQLDHCLHAVRAMQTLAPATRCSVPSSFSEHFEPFVADLRSTLDSELELQACTRLARLLWAGESASIPNRFATVPTLDDIVITPEKRPATNMHKLRRACEERVGSGEQFEAALRKLSDFGRAFGENPAAKPWILDPGSKRPIEAVRAARALTTQRWLSSLIQKNAACTALELDDARCHVCADAPESAYFDCSLLTQVRNSWRLRTLRAGSKLAVALAALLLVLWLVRLRRALRAHSAWLRQVTSHLRGLELGPEPDRLRFLFPSRMQRLRVRLPKTSAWERWGSTAVVVHAHGPKLQARDVDAAASAALAARAELSLLVHEDGVAPELGAVRALLDWAARGSNRSAHVLPLPQSRLEWASRSADLLQLAEESSLRSNPFEVRGRIASSSQFFNRERLVSGLLAGAHLGRFVVVTGLRRFGKSSLALEVARRLPGPSAYVDLAGFHHEIRYLADPAQAADKILHFLCSRLLESARAFYAERLRPLALPEGSIDATVLAEWFRGFFAATADARTGRPPAVLLILDEIEQAIGAAQQLSHALEVFAILVGRLRNALPSTPQDPGQRVGILFCSALHPLLWAPLGTLAHQSLIGCYEYVSVPSLPAEAAVTMMRGLGSLHGIRFTDEAVDLLVEESQGAPLLLRRLGSAVLELYDAERARQGALGAVEIGVEGVRAAVQREESKGSPLRVWVESEIAAPTSPGGVVLRHLACRDRCSARELQETASRAFREQFASTGVSAALAPEEALRRAEEAGAVVLRILGDSGLLVATGDPSDPEAYELPEGILRRVLSGGATEPPLRDEPSPAARL